MGHRKNLTLSKEPALWKYKYSIMNIICHHEHSVSVAKYIPIYIYLKKYTQKCAYSLMINIQTFTFSKQKGFFWSKKNLSLGKSIMKKLGCFTCFIWLSALYIYRYISRSDLETSKKTCAAPFLIFREDIIKVDRKSAYFFDKILPGFLCT